MSSCIPYTQATYLNRIKMSDDYKFLLVEGSDDKRLFKLLRDEFSGINKEWENLVIHSAEEFKGVKANGARGIIEQLCKEIERFTNASNFAGFVDREFREFDLSYDIKDKISIHFVSGRLVWSRGHSVENYYFDFSVLKQPLRSFSVTEYFDSALSLFEQHIRSVIKLACAASLAGHECNNRLKLVKSSIDWTLMNMNSGILSINLDLWKQNLVQRIKVEEVYANHLIDCFSIWLSRVEHASNDVIRWLCHGHIGLAFLWAAYGKCVYEVCQSAGVNSPELHVQRVLKAEESVRFNACADSWVTKILGNQCLYPNELFHLLSLPISKQ